ncbi:hypothetical protein SMY44_000308 [Cronobacter sakazakii]|nr:hypothetical protein [Cronobacter sakazakii]ELY4028050.1 hypothetical protein [Cronobacter sakazakii]
MTDTAKLKAVPRHSVDGYGRQDICYNDPEGEFVFYSDYEALKDALEAAQKRIAELEEQKAKWVSWAEQASGEVDKARQRIAELESGINLETGGEA